MRRRVLLASLGVLSAGCLGSSPPRSNNTTPASPTGETSTPTTTEPCDRVDDHSTTDTSDEGVTDGEYNLTGLTASVSSDQPSFKYVLEQSASYSGDAVERKEERTGEKQVVRDISAADNTKVRTAIETAIRSGEWRSNTLPDGLAETVDRVDFFTGVSKSDIYTHRGVTLYQLQPDQPPAVEFSAAVADGSVSAESPGVIAFTLRNTRRSTQYVSAGTVPPFGMVFAEAVESDGRFLLWRDYEEEGCIDFVDDEIVKCSIGTVIELQPCESITRRYEVLPSNTTHRPRYTVPPESGTYRITDSVAYYGQQGAPQSELSFEVDFTLESPE